MKPIPILFHIGPLQIHTYGIGLAVTFLFAYQYFARRLRAHGYPSEWLGGAFLWIIAAAVIGARIAHVLTNLSIYTADPIQVFEVWHGGLSSFGGLALGLPVGFYLAHRRCPGLRMWVAADLLAPVLVAAWAVGRVLGPQLMFAGGGYRTNAWYGMYYSGQVGKRLPVPLLQAAECAVIFGILILIERRFAARGGAPTGFIATAAIALWDLSRLTDERFFLDYPGHQAGGAAVEITAGVVAVLGFLAMLVLWLRWRRRPAPAVSGDSEGSEAGPGPEPADVEDVEDVEAKPSPVPVHDA